jgi:hypothetical protein
MTLTTAKWTIDEYHQMVDAGILRDTPSEQTRRDFVSPPQIKKKLNS